MHGVEQEGGTRRLFLDKIRISQKSHDEGSDEGIIRPDVGEVGFQGCQLLLA